MSHHRLPTRHRERGRPVAPGRLISPKLGRYLIMFSGRLAVLGSWAWTLTKYLDACRGWTLTPLGTTLDRLAATADEHEHLLPPGGAPARVSEALRAAGASDSSPLRGFLERFNGAVLFEGALAFNYVQAPPAGFTDALTFEVEDLVDDNTRSRESFGVSTPPGVVLFARSLGGHRRPRAGEGIQRIGGCLRAGCCV
jgi:hypothetical protein